ncbi:hypothetical protein CROQUDRAFT_51137, partial [Cronartium quercuum f. sp. fusiforme G11]
LGKWLIKKLKNIHKTLKETNSALHHLYQQKNPHDPECHFYSADFLEEQWKLEWEVQATTKQAEEKQWLELGCLLCDEQELYQIW